MAGTTRYVPKGTTDLATVTISAGDYVIFGEGSQTISAGTDKSALSQLRDVIVKRQFTGNIVDLQFGHSNQTSYIFQYDAGGGSMSIIANASTTDTIYKVLHTGLGTLTAKTTGTITEWQQESGIGFIQDSITVTNVRLNGGNLTQQYKSTQNTGWTIGGGMFTTGRGFTGTANVGGGTIIVRKEDSAASSLPTAGTLNVIGPAKIVWNGGNILSGLNLLHPDAVFDWRNAPTSMTINALTGFAKALARSNLPTRASQAGTLAFTNLNQKALTLTANATVYGGKVENYIEFSGSGGSGT